MRIDEDNFIETARAILAAGGSIDLVSSLGAGTRVTVVVERRGGFIHPVVVELEFDDGHVVRHDWDGRGRWVRFTDTRPAKLVRAEVDPDRVLALDVDRLNNGRLLEGDATARRKIVTQILYWLQNLVEATTIVG